MFNLNGKTRILRNTEKSRKALGYTLRLLTALLLIFSSVFVTFAQQPNRPSRPEQNLGNTSWIIADTSKFPFSAIVKLLVTFPYGDKEGTGALIAANKVLTAEHVVYDESLGGHFIKVEVLPGYSNNYESCARTQVVYYSHGSHDGCHDGAKCDIAVLTTRENMGCNTGWFGFKQFDDSDLNDVFIAGYPHNIYEGEVLYVARGRAAHFHSNSGLHNLLSYPMFTAKGMSGGPIYTRNYQIVGLHTNGKWEATNGIALCNQLFSSIRDWIYK